MSTVGFLARSCSVFVALTGEGGIFEYGEREKTHRKRVAYPVKTEKNNQTEKHAA